MCPRLYLNYWCVCQVGDDHLNYWCVCQVADDQNDDIEH